MDALIVIARATALLAGGILVGSIFLYEDQEGGVHSTFENWRVRASDTGQEALRVHRNLVAIILSALRRMARSVIYGNFPDDSLFVRTLLFSFMLTTEFLLMFLPFQVYPAGALYRTGVGLFLAIFGIWALGNFRNSIAVIFLLGLAGAVLVHGMITGTFGVTFAVYVRSGISVTINALYITFWFVRYGADAPPYTLERGECPCMGLRRTSVLDRVHASRHVYVTDLCHRLRSLRARHVCVG